ncbi:MAG: ChbG/HpnK family deacetylase, partial [Fimbriiglobus sp.]|nr:ChbG/HpnK family deacetylase [Fimbriiglobus sp.]
MPRRLIVTADDFGVGPATSRGILDLAAAGVVTSAVVLVNSPHVEECVWQWQQSGQHLELGWHPCLTMDAPVLPAAQVPTLVDDRGRFHPLGTFLKRLLRGQVNRTEIDAELTAQHRRFLELIGRPPASMNGHHHIHIFRPVGEVLLKLLAEHSPKPFVRRVREPLNTLLRVPGVRLKRCVLNWLGGGAVKRQAR